MTQAKLESLLGRSLTPNEVTNLTLYLDIATDSLEDMLCMSLTTETSTREFEAREGYSTLFTGAFTDVSEVTVDESVIDESQYKFRQWNKSNAEWFNSIVFNYPQSGTVKVTADWGFGDCMPNDLQLLLARSFDQISKSNTSQGSIQSKQVEDFRITYRNDVTQRDQFLMDNGLIIQKYSLCNIGNIQHGSVCGGRSIW